MKTEADWHQVALDKLTRVLGDEAARELMSDVLRELSLDRLATVDDLRRFGGALADRGGFAAALGGMLNLHATIHARPT